MKNIKALGFKQINSNFFDTLQFCANASEIKKIAEEREINFYYPDKNTICISLNETTNNEDVKEITSIF